MGHISGEEGSCNHTLCQGGGINLFMVLTSKLCSTTCPRLVVQVGERQNTQTITRKRIVQQIESLVCTNYVTQHLCQ